MTFHIFSDSKWSWRNHPWPSFDWFDLHSWSRGLAPNPEGKDEESTSEPWGLAAAVGNRHAVVFFFGEVLLKGNVQKLFKGECLNEYVSHWTSFLGMQFVCKFLQLRKSSIFTLVSTFGENRLEGSLYSSWVRRCVLAAMMGFDALVHFFFHLPASCWGWLWQLQQYKSSFWWPRAARIFAFWVVCRCK